ncbi:hypothetical protein NQ317_008127 [Molorchus minor]|uniref:Retinol dehydrogenase 14 n=1 Tax=Molorchus minor TaxID=1323400 RepID=A0ABQ9IZ71_9CUCU|nr:hypothetical protein NQ317_008127 [Molorchus minor]
MILLGVDFGCPLVQALLAILIVGFLTVISLLKFYAYVTCGYFHERVRMDGKTVIITGANGGIGKETAREIAKRGARVMMACRNTESGKAVRKDINKTESRLDVLIHNAGTGESKFKKTEDDLELTMATNHFGPFLLTHLLIELLKKSGPSRIVVVASELYRLASLNLNNLNPTSSWCPAYLYYVSKYANICFTLELARRLEGTGVTANCLHPGMVDSGIWRNVPFPLNFAFKVVIKGFFKTPLQGCQTSVFLACSEEVQKVTGRYFMDCKERGLSGGAADESKAKKLWELSEKFASLRPTDPKI